MVCEFCTLYHNLTNFGDTGMHFFLCNTHLHSLTYKNICARAYCVRKRLNDQHVPQGSYKNCNFNYLIK